MIDLEVFESDELLALIKIDVEQNKMDEALYKLKHLTIKSDAPEESYSLLARVYAKLGLYRRAREWYTKFINNQPEAIIEKFQLGLTYHDEELNDEAVKVWDELLLAEANYPPALFYKALVFSNAGHIVDAQAMLNALFETAQQDNIYVEQGRELAKTLDEQSITKASANVASISEASTEPAIKH